MDYQTPEPDVVAKDLIESIVYDLEVQSQEDRRMAKELRGEQDILSYFYLGAANALLATAWILRGKMNA